MLRRRGIDVARLGKGEKGKKTRTLERVMKVVAGAIIVVQLQLLSIGYCDLWVWVIGFWCDVPAWFTVAGGVVAGAGVAFFLLAVVAMKENWRAGIDATQQTSLVTGGVYSISRNPAFVGFDLLYIGIAAMFPNPVLVVLSLGGVVVFTFRYWPKRSICAPRSALIMRLMPGL